MTATPTASQALADPRWWGHGADTIEVLAHMCASRIAGGQPAVWQELQAFEYLAAVALWASRSCLPGAGGLAVSASDIAAGIAGEEMMLWQLAEAGEWLCATARGHMPSRAKRTAEKGARR
jgi:hypothetical protein